MKQAGGKTADLTFQSSGEVLNNDYDLKNGNNPYYQWGRKDPMLPGNGIGDTDKSCYPGSPEYKFKYGSEGLNTSDIKEYIRNPHKFNIKPEMDGKYYNLWSTDNERTDANDDVVIKSVYDPSPVGYSLPASNAFTGFTDTGLNTGNPAEYNVYGVFDKGWYFYCKPNKQGETVFFQTFGWRLHNPGKQERFNIGGWLWTSGTNIKTEGRGFGFRLSAAVFPLDYDLYRSYGLAVRSAEEMEKEGNVRWRKLQSVFGLRCVDCRELQGKTVSAMTA